MESGIKLNSEKENNNNNNIVEDDITFNRLKDLQKLLKKESAIKELFFRMKEETEKSIESQFIQINLNVECIENSFETNKTVYIKYFNYIEIKDGMSVKKNVSWAYELLNIILSVVL